MVRIESNGRTERIGLGAYPLGIKTGLQWEEIRGSLTSGDRLLLHSDGLTEARDINGREFGDTYVDAVISWNPSANARKLVDTLVTEWKKFSGKRPAEDDVSIAVIGRVSSRA